MNWNGIKQHLNTCPPRLVTDRSPAAVLVLFAGDALVLEVRSPRLRTQPGEVCLPGGGMEPGETPVQCAVREACEELGIAAADINVIGQTDYVLHRTGQIIYPVLAQAEPGLPERIRSAPDEVSEVFTLPLSWLEGHPPRRYEYQLQAIHNDTLPPQMMAWAQSYSNLRRGIYWDYEGRLIWGLTARLIQMALELIPLNLSDKD
jgi:8-oxo-dGTP pyrophosphatase MutT (NUDIX family)